MRESLALHLAHFQIHIYSFEIHTKLNVVILYTVQCTVYISDGNFSLLNPYLFI